MTKTKQSREKAKPPAEGALGEAAAEVQAEPLEQATAQAVQPQPAPEAPPSPAEEAPATLEEALERWSAARALSDEYLDGWQRARAEFANYKKRIERDLDQARSSAAADLLTRFLPIVDDIERALRDQPDEESIRPWAAGIELIHRKLIGLLEAEGVEVIDAVGASFDPNVHEAISFEDNDEVEHGKVIGITQQGYRLRERVLRPAMVRVAR